MGFKILFRGFLLRTLKRTVGTALTWAFFDQVINRLNL